MLYIGSRSVFRSKYSRNIPLRFSRRSHLQGRSIVSNQCSDPVLRFSDKLQHLHLDPSSSALRLHISLKNLDARACSRQISLLHHQVQNLHPSKWSQARLCKHKPHDCLLYCGTARTVHLPFQMESYWDCSKECSSPPSIPLLGYPSHYELSDRHIRSETLKRKFDLVVPFRRDGLLHLPLGIRHSSAVLMLRLRHVKFLALSITGSQGKESQV